MRRTRLILGVISLLVFIFPGLSSSQINYVMNPTAPFSYVLGTESITSWVGDADDGYFEIPLGDFLFQFYGVPVTTLRVSTNGYMTFGTEGREYFNAPIPYFTLPNALIAPFWTDLDLTVSGQVRWSISGLSPSRQLVVEWVEVPSFDLGGSYSFEAILCESTNVIKFQYLNVVSGIPYDYGASSTVGTEDFDGASGSQFSYNTPSLNNNLAIEFTPKITTVFMDDFSTDKGWTGYAPGGWERAPAVAGVAESGNPDPGVDHSFSSDNTVLGFAIGADYPNDLIEKSIISPLINCTEQSQVFLKFWRYLNVGSNYYDHAKVYVSNDGTNWTQVWENPVFDLTDDQWIPVVYDISSIAANQATVYIKFAMGPTNASGRFSGWNIDDLEVTSVYNGPMALYVPSGGMPNPNIDEMLTQAGLSVKHFNAIPSDLSDYDLLIVSDNGACNSTTANYIRTFVQNGGGAVVMSGTPYSLAGDSADLSSIKDWLGAGLYGNDGGYATVTVPNPFGTDLLIDDKVDYSAANLSAAVYNLEADASLISKWSSNGTHSFYYRFDQGRVFYYSGNPGYSEDPNPIIAENGLILFEAGLLWAAGCSGPVITIQPQSQTIQSGQATSLWVSASGTAPLTYQWYQGPSGDTSIPIAGATADLYTTPSLTQTTNYWVRVSNACGSADSNTATITVTAACASPTLTSQPQSQTIQSGQTASMSVSASGTSPFSYQWYQGSSGDTSNPITGATSNSYTTPALTQTTSYWVGVTNSCGNVNSNTATITVTVPITDISVVSPNGGETWPAASMQTIRWTYTSNLTSSVKVELLKGGVVNRVIVPSASKGSGGSGSRNWTIPANQPPGTDYRIRVTSTTNGSYTDTSDNDFTIAAPTITVDSPNGSETWSAGLMQTIHWNYTGNPGAYVKIELLKGGVVNHIIASSAGKGRGGSGSRNWTIPANQAPGTDYTIRVTSTSNSAYTDTSDSNFTIAAPTITVVSPNGGEVWTIGSTQTIHWNYTGNPGSYVKIELLKGGVVDRTIASPGKGVGGSGSRNWTIPSNQAPGIDYTIRVTSTSNGAYTDTSDNDFTIQ